MSTELSAALFEPLVNQNFRLTLGGETIEAELMQVSGLTGDTKREDRSPFSLLFRGPEGVSFEQQILTVAHDDIGEHAIFLVPLGPDVKRDDPGMLYEAVFT